MHQTFALGEKMARRKQKWSSTISIIINYQKPTENGLDDGSKSQIVLSMTQCCFFSLKIRRYVRQVLTLNRNTFLSLFLLRQSVSIFKFFYCLQSNTNCLFFIYPYNITDRTCQIVHMLQSVTFRWQMCQHVLFHEDILPSILSESEALNRRMLIYILLGHWRIFVIQRKSLVLFKF